MNRASARGPLLASLLALVVLGSLTAQLPPAAVPVDAPETVFSAHRAHEHLRVIAAEPHPVGSAANRRVRDALVEVLDEFGMRSEVQRTAAVSTRFGVTAIVENVVGRLPGTSGEAAVLLVAHYDSVPNAPGAADNGAAVAAVLETLRALLAGPPLANDVIVLFSDAEEVGLLGAEAFVAEHPWWGEVGMVLNFEARGSSGPSVLVETSPTTAVGRGNSAVVAAFSAAVAYPNASSFASAVYDLLPNDTDFSVFKAQGTPGLNFAFIRGAAHYHTPRDALDTVSLASLQHHGEHMLELTRHFGDADLAAFAGAAHGTVYVDVFRRWVLRYPVGLAVPLAVVALALWLGAVTLARRRDHLRLRGVAAAVLALTVALGLSVGIGIGLHALLRAAHPAAATAWLAAPYGVEVTMLGFALSAVAATLSVARAARAWLGPMALALGGALVWVLSSLASALWLPAGSYLTTLPALAFVTGLLLVGSSREAPGTKPWHLVVLPLAVLPGLVLLPPFIHEGFVGVGLGLAAPVLVLVGLTAWLLTPLLDVMSSPHRWALPAVAWLGSAAALLVGAAGSTFGPDQPGPSNAFYVVDPEVALALFVSVQQEGDAWTDAFVESVAAPEGALQQLLPDAPADLRHGSAPVLGLAAPELIVVADERSGDSRRLDLRLAASREAHQLALLLRSDSLISDVRFEGRPVASLAAVHGFQALVSYGPMREGVSVSFTLAADAPLEAVLIDRSHDLLTLPDLGIPPRPADLMAAPNVTSDAVMVSSRWQLE